MAGIDTIGTVVSFQATAAGNALKQQVRNVQSAEPGKEAKAEETVSATETAPVKESAEASEEKSAAEYADQQNQQAQQAQQSAQATQEQIKKAVEQFNKHFGNSEAVFGIHDDTNRVTIKIVDKQTKEVIKELPPEKTLDMIARVWEMAGILVDEKR